MIGIYMIQNKIDKKIYIGQSSDIYIQDGGNINLF